MLPIASPAPLASTKNIVVHKMTIQLSYSDDQIGRQYQDTRWTWHLWCRVDAQRTVQHVEAAIEEARQGFQHAQSNIKDKSITIHFWSSLVEEMPVIELLSDASDGELSIFELKMPDGPPSGYGSSSYSLSASTRALPRILARSENEVKQFATGQSPLSAALGGMLSVKKCTGKIVSWAQVVELLAGIRLTRSSSASSSAPDGDGSKNSGSTAGSRKRKREEEDGNADGDTKDGTPQDTETGGAGGTSALEQLRDERKQLRARLEKLDVTIAKMEHAIAADKAAKKANELKMISSRLSSQTIVPESTVEWRKSSWVLDQEMNDEEDRFKAANGYRPFH